MIRAGVDLAFAACADNVARAVLVVAKKRAAAMNLLLLVSLGEIASSSERLATAVSKTSCHCRQSEFKPVGRH